MTASNVAATQAVAYKFLDAHFAWLPKPTIIESTDPNDARDHATATTISVPKYSDAWNDGRSDVVIHECGHVLAFWLGSKNYPIIEQFLAAFGAPADLLHDPMVNEMFAEHFARAYCVGYAGANYLQLVGIVPFDADKMRSFCEALVPPTTNLVVPVPVPFSSPQPSSAGATAGWRYCFDSTTAVDIPAGAAIVAGYVDGAFAWSDADWALFPDSVKVRIACFAGTNDGHVGDVERGDMFPADAPGWATMRRAAGVDPTIYCSIGAWPAVRAAFAQAGVAEPHYWIAHYDNDPTPIAGAVAKQYANPTFTGHHYDTSVVPGRWPGVEEEEMDRDTFNAWFLEEYKKVGAGAKFDELATQIGGKAEKTHGHTAKTTASTTVS